MVWKVTHPLHVPVDIHVLRGRCLNSFSKSYISHVVLAYGVWARVSHTGKAICREMALSMSPNVLKVYNSTNGFFILLASCGAILCHRKEKHKKPILVSKSYWFHVRDDDGRGCVRCRRSPWVAEQYR
jgi:hypothetical protein